MNYIKAIEATKDAEARLEGLREYFKSENDLDLQLAVIEAEHRVLDVRAMIISKMGNPV